MHGWLDITTLLLIVGVGLIATIGVFGHTIWKERQMARLLALASKRLAGKVVGKGMGHPELRLTHSGVTGNIKFFHRRGHGAGNYSLLVFDLPRNAAFGLHLVSQGGPTVLAMETALEEPIRLADPGLARFQVRTNEPQRAQLMLNSDAARALNRLGQLHPKGHLEMALQGRELVLQLPTYLKRADQVLGLGFMGQKLLDRYLAASGHGGGLPVEPEAPKTCTLCDQAIQSDGSACAYCDASWHADCAAGTDTCPACGAPSTDTRTS